MVLSSYHLSAGRGKYVSAGDKSSPGRNNKGISGLQGGGFVLVAFFRTLILYIVIVFGVRLMGKRQLGELQPSELVVTILISNIATLPIEEVETPLFAGLLPILSLVTFEVIISAVNLHCRKVRRIFSGTPMVVIQNGEVDQQKLKELRFSIDDLMAQLRSNQIFSLEEVDFAVVETTGKLSVYQKYGARPLTPQTLGMPDQPAENAPPLVVVSDGHVYQEYLSLCGRDIKWLEETAASRRVAVRDIFVMTLDQAGNYHLVKKEGAV